MTITYTCPHCHTVVTVAAQHQRCDICGAESIGIRPLYRYGKEMMLCEKCTIRELHKPAVKAGPSEAK